MHWCTRVVTLGLLTLLLSGGPALAQAGRDGQAAKGGAEKAKAQAGKAAEAAGAWKIDRSRYRIAGSHDGNFHDPDDIGASAMTLAMVGAAGLQDRLVHFDYGNHLGDSSKDRENEMQESARGAAQRWGIPEKVLFDDQKDLDAAVANLARQINASSADDPLFICAAGPMETVWRAIDASEKDRRPFVTVVSHSTWNEKHADTPQMKHTWDDVKKTGVKTIDISDQNRNLSTEFAAWEWLKTSDKAEWKWLHSRPKTRKFDVSDAGMMWFVITGRGDQNGTPAKVRELFEKGDGPGAARGNP